VYLEHICGCLILKGGGVYLCGRVDVDSNSRDEEDKILFFLAFAFAYH
jgi:hypothetical protein